MKKLLFLTHITKDLSNGVWKKVQAQANALHELGYLVDLVYYDAGSLVIESHNKKIAYPLLHRYFIFYILSRKINCIYDVVYFRKPHGGLYPLFSFMPINKIRKANALTKVFFEIPTYPYKNESEGFLGYISYLSYKLSLCLFKKNISKILYIGEGPEKIYGIKAQKMNNGVDESRVKFLGSHKRDVTRFTFAGIANLMYWHGYDRLINAIAESEYRDIISFYIVGDTEPEYSRLKKLVHDKGVENQVHFLGRMEDDEINKLLEEVNVCVDALGRHRSGNNNNSSIKSKEYAAMGIPFIKSHVDDAFDNEFFIYQVNADESNINISEIILWYKKLPTDFARKERNFAIDNFSWTKILKNALNS
ncbi:glycosyltransferase [Klebsiella pneumoniae]